MHTSVAPVKEEIPDGEVSVAAYTPAPQDVPYHMGLRMSLDEWAQAFLGQDMEYQAALRAEQQQQQQQRQHRCKKNSDKEP